MNPPKNPDSSQTAASVADERRDDARFEWRAIGMLSVLCGAIFLETADISLMGIALPAIQAELNFSTSALQWVVSAYILGYGGFVLLGGRAADIFGRRKMFLFWLAVFMAFSWIGGIATQGWMLILARFVTGLSAAFLAPAGLSIITTSFSNPRQRERALIIYGATGAAGFSLGLIVGGLLTAIDWRWSFFAPVIAAAVIFIGAIVLIPRSTKDPTATRERFDFPGALTLTVGMSLLIFVIAEAPHASGIRTAVLGAVSLGILAGFVFIEQRAKSPLVRLRVFRSAALIRTNLSSLLFSASYLGFQFIAVLYMQQFLGWSPLKTGLALLLIGIDLVLAPTLTPALIRRYGTAKVILAGLLCHTVGVALFLGIGQTFSYPQMLPSTLLIGLAFTLAFGTLVIAATQGSPESEQGLVSGLLNAGYQFGGAIGVAAVTAIYSIYSDSMGELASYRLALIAPIIAALLATAVAISQVLTTSRAARRRPT